MLKIKKILGITLSVLLILSAVPILSLAYDTYTSEDGYLTYIVENGEATIIGCDDSISGAYTIPDALDGYPVTTIEAEDEYYYGFSGCDSLTSITIPDSVTSIDYRAFCGCDSLTSITIGNSVKTIGFEVFSGCTALISITIPDSVTSISDSVFSGCESLTSIDIPDSVTSIGAWEFEDCISLTSVIIPDSVTEIGIRAFYNCTSLSSVAIGNSVTSIGSSAFSYCTSLTSIVIPDNVTSIGMDAFSNCTALAIIYGSSGSAAETYANENGINFISTDKNTEQTASEGYLAYEIENGEAKITGCEISIRGEYAIPDTLNGYAVTSIGVNAFLNCMFLESITIPGSVTLIEPYAFANCASLKSVTIPDSVTSIGSWAFAACASLADITIPDSVTYIDSYVFYNCTSLESIIIPKSVTSISSDAFSGCDYDFIIYGYDSTAAETYANENGITFISLGEYSEPEEPTTAESTTAEPATEETTLSSRSIPPEAVEFNGNYYFVYENALTWEEAEEYCESLGGHLVAITSEEENTFVTSLISSYSSAEDFYIGITDKDNDSDWSTWVTGEAVTYTNWGIGEPDGVDGQQDYGVIVNGSRTGRSYSISQGQWDDREITPLYFICEWEDDSSGIFIYILIAALIFLVVAAIAAVVIVVLVTKNKKPKNPQPPQYNGYYN
ncbi:MAG: leucine-rich repeat protein [Clostridiales bacterium]|nr:leucine-rich repeat protein [Clostridiales bacterium]